MEKMPSRETSSLITPKIETPFVALQQWWSIIHLQQTTAMTLSTTSYSAPTPPPRCSTVQQMYITLLQAILNNRSKCATVAVLLHPAACINGNAAGKEQRR